MSVQNQLAQVEELATEIASRSDAPQVETAAKPKKPLSEDEIWARKNLRWQGGRPIADIANALRIFDRHEDYKGRFKFNEMVNRVLDKGTVMIDWRIAELCAIVQERFIPGIDEAVVSKGLMIAAYRTGVKN